MPPTDPTSQTRADQPLLPTLRRFLPYLWPAGETGLKARIVVAMLLVVASKIVQVFGAAYTLKYAVDRMSVGDRSLVTIVVLLVVGYAASRFSTTLFDNLRNAVFERVGQDATRRLAAVSSVTCTACRCASIWNGAPAPSPRWSNAAPRASIRCCISCCSISRRPCWNWPWC